MFFDPDWAIKQGFHILLSLETKGAFHLWELGQPERSVRKWSASFLRSESTNTSKLHNQRNVSAILKKLEELAYNQAFKLENSVREMTGLAGQLWQMECVLSKQLREKKKKRLTSPTQTYMEYTFFINGVR